MDGGQVWAVLCWGVLVGWLECWSVGWVAAWTDGQMDGWTGRLMRTQRLRCLRQAGMFRGACAYRAEVRRGGSRGGFGRVRPTAGGGHSWRWLLLAHTRAWSFPRTPPSRSTRRDTTLDIPVAEQPFSHSPPAVVLSRRQPPSTATRRVESGTRPACDGGRARPDAALWPAPSATPPGGPCHRGGCLTLLNPATLGHCCPDLLSPHKTHVRCALPYDCHFDFLFEIPPIITPATMTSVQLETPHSGKYTQPTGL